MPTQRIVTVILLIIFGVVIFFYSSSSSGTKEITPRAFPDMNARSGSIKTMFQDRGYTPEFNGKVQKYVDDKLVIDDKIIKLNDQNKRLRLLEIELQNKLIQQKTDAELKRSLRSQLTLNNELSMEELTQLDNSEKDRQLQIDKTIKVVEQVTSTIKKVDANLVIVQIVNNKEHEEKLQLISDEITEKKKQVYLKLQEAKRLAEEAKKDKEDRAAAFRAKMAKYNESKVVIEPTKEETYARALEIALKKKAIRLQAEAEMKQKLDARRKLIDELSESEPVTVEDAENSRQATIDENDRLMEEAQRGIENANVLRDAAQAKLDEEFNALVSETEKQREDEEKRLADIAAKNLERIAEYQTEFDQAQQDQTDWDQAVADIVQNNSNLEIIDTSEYEAVQSQYELDSTRDYAAEVNADAMLTEADWLITQATETAQANADMEAGVGGNLTLIANSLDGTRRAAMEIQDKQDLIVGRANLKMFKLGYPPQSPKPKYDVERNTFIASTLPILPYINPLNGFDTWSDSASEIVGPGERGRWLISKKIIPSVEEQLQSDMHAAQDRGDTKEFEALLAKNTALGLERDFQIITAAQNNTDDNELLMEDPLASAVSHGFDDFGYIRRKPTTSNFQPLIDECKFRCNKFHNCGGFALDENMQFCKLVNKDTLDLKPGGVADAITGIKSTVNSAGVGHWGYHMYYKVPETESQKIQRNNRVSQRARIIQLLPGYEKIPDPDAITGDDGGVQDISLRREAQFNKLLSDEELFKQCKNTIYYDKKYMSCKKFGCPPRDALTAISPLNPGDCRNFIDNLKNNIPTTEYTRRQNTSVPSTASKWMIDIDVNTGLPTTDSNMSRVSGGMEECMKVCNKFSSCKSFVIGPKDVPVEDKVCHLKSEQGEGMAIPSTTHNMFFKKRGISQRVATPEELKNATWIDDFLSNPEDLERQIKDWAAPLTIPDDGWQHQWTVASPPGPTEILLPCSDFDDGYKDDGKGNCLSGDEIVVSRSDRNKVRLDAINASREATKRNQERLAAEAEAAAITEKRRAAERLEAERKRKEDAALFLKRINNEWVDEGGITPVIMCSPLDDNFYGKPIDCKRKRGVMTCAEFIDCYKSNNRTLCEDEKGDKEDGFYWEYPMTSLKNGSPKQWKSCKFEIMQENAKLAAESEAAKMEAIEREKEVEALRVRNELNKDAAVKLEKLQETSRIEALARVEAAAQAFKKTPEYKARMVKKYGAGWSSPDHPLVVPTVKAFVEMSDADIIAKSDADAKAKAKADADAANDELRAWAQQRHLDNMRRYEEAKAAEQRSGWGWGW